MVTKGLLIYVKCFPSNLIFHLPFQITKLMERVETTFIKHFSNSNRIKGMKILRPKAMRERHRTTFSTGTIFYWDELNFLKMNWDQFWYQFLSLEFGLVKTLGFFAGCTVALILALILIIRARNIMDKPEATKYMENMFPLYRYISSWIEFLGFLTLIPW